MQYLAVELFGADVGLEEVVGAPPDGGPEVLRLAGRLVGRGVGEAAPGQGGQGRGHWVTELHVVAGWGKVYGPKGVERNHALQ